MTSLEVVNLGDRVQPRGWISVTAPTMFGRLHVLPLVRSFLNEYPQVDVRLLLLDRVVSLVDEVLDLGVRIGQLPDSALRSVRVGQVRRVVCASRNTSLATGRQPRRAISRATAWWPAQPSRRFPTAGRSIVRGASRP